MNCEACHYGVFDHYVEGSPRAVYTCGYCYGLTDEGDCRLTKPDEKLLKTVVGFLEDIGLKVYGEHADLDDGVVIGGCMDYSTEDILKLYDHIKNGTIKYK